MTTTPITHRVHKAGPADAADISRVLAGRQAWGYVGLFADPDGHLWQFQSDADAG